MRNERVKMKLKKLILLAAILTFIFAVTGVIIYQKSRPTEIIVTGSIEQLSEQQLI